MQEDEDFFNNDEKNRIKKDEQINKYKQEIEELKEKLNDKDDASKIKSNDDKIYDDMPYLELKKKQQKE